MKVDKKVFYIGSAAASVLFISLAVQGCDVQKAIKFDVPTGVRVAVDTKERESLSDSEFVWGQWTSYVESNTAKLSENIKGAQGRVAMIENLTSMGLSTLEGVSGQFPGGALAFSGLSLMTGWFLKRPGENKAVEKEKEKSFNAGLEKAKNLLLDNIKDDKNA
tara:strand:+ start:957 stop:1445 length:489 start_codon:yes stop_codon:yes gene_type:complete